MLNLLNFLGLNILKFILILLNLWWQYYDFLVFYTNPLPTTSLRPLPYDLLVVQGVIDDAKVSTNSIAGRGELSDWYA